MRLDTWLEPGGQVPPFYDSQLGKLIVWGHDRQTAVARARRALGELEVQGVKTTAPLLARLLEEDWFTAGEHLFGGYAKIATVISADMDTVAQSAPRSKTRFVPVELDAALAARRERNERLHRLQLALG